MKTSVQGCFLVLLLVTEAFAQQSASLCEQNEAKFAAVVMETVAGTCKVRDNETAPPRTVKSGVVIQPGLALKCEAGAHLKIRFCNSGAEKEIGPNAVKWYVVPYVPLLHKPSGLVPSLRWHYWYCDRSGLCPPYEIVYHRDEVVLKEIKLWELYQQKESKALGEAMSDNFYAIYPDGQKVSKQTFLHDMSKINLKDFLWSDVHVGFSEDRRTLNYVVIAHLLKDGKESAVLIDVTSNWIRQGGKWHIISHQQKNTLENEG